VPEGPVGTAPPRRAVLAVFFFHVGFLPANWLVRLPDVKDQVDASASTLGLALLSQSIGGLIATLLAARLCLRFGSRRVMVVGAWAVSLVLALPTLTVSPATLGAVLILLGITHSTFNVALNSTAVETASASGNPLMPTLHGVYSVGGLLGAATGGLASERLTPLAHLVLVSGLGLLASVWFGIGILRAATRPKPGSTRSAAGRSGNEAEGGETSGSDSPSIGYRWEEIRWVVAAFGVIAACTAFSEFANNNWATLHLRDDLGASPAVAAYGFATYAAAIAVGRFLGARTIRWLGETAVLAGGFSLAAVGVLVTSWAGQLPGGLPLAFGAYILVGLGLANIWPLAISRAGVLGGPRGVSRIAVAGGLGILAQAPLIGLVADLRGLPTALSMVTLLALLGAVLAVALRRWSTATPQVAATTSPARTAS
jgi:fucose permease